MATEKDLHNAFINFSVAYLDGSGSDEVNEKIFESIAKVVLKMDTSEYDLPDLPDGGLAKKELDKLKEKIGSK